MMNDRKPILGAALAFSLVGSGAYAGHPLAYPWRWQ